ncbi:unnamed protein product [Polarella glacialis]|uniref:Uncharacterized protein n=1 Tax=Polarella glacialis TaxID=89957 RepID=A0A813IUJ7_POLGL|nr:unnamed protein product [Polarella glacialis]
MAAGALRPPSRTGNSSWNPREEQAFSEVAPSLGAKQPQQLATPSTCNKNHSSLSSKSMHSNTTNGINNDPETQHPSRLAQQKPADRLSQASQLHSCRADAESKAQQQQQQQPAASEKPRKHMSPHFCIFQVDDWGLDGWSLEEGCRKGRWDTLLDVLLKCVMVDGRWPREVEASLFAGGDAMHINGAIQSLAMPAIFRRADGTTARQPATFQYWQDMLWEQRGVDHPGLRWERAAGWLSTFQKKRDELLRRLDTLLDAAPRESIAVVLDYKDVDRTFEDLKRTGCDHDPRAERVYLLLGGAHGFDGKDDVRSEMFNIIVGQFTARLGANRVVRTNLCKNAKDMTKFTAAQVASFLSTEYRRRMLADAVAGAELLAGLHAAAQGGDSLKDTATLEKPPHAPGSSNVTPGDTARWGMTSCNSNINNNTNNHNSTNNHNNNNSNSKNNNNNSNSNSSSSSSRQLPPAPLSTPPPLPCITTNNNRNSTNNSNSNNNNKNNNNNNNNDSNTNNSTNNSNSNSNSSSHPGSPEQGPCAVLVLLLFLLLLFV